MSRAGREVLDVVVQLLTAACYLWSVAWFFFLIMSAEGAFDGPGPVWVYDVLPPVVCLTFVVLGAACAWNCHRWLRRIHDASRGPMGFDVLPPR